MARSPRKRKKTSTNKKARTPQKRTKIRSIEEEDQVPPLKSSWLRSGAKRKWPSKFFMPLHNSESKFNVPIVDSYVKQITSPPEDEEIQKHQMKHEKILAFWEKKKKIIAQHQSSLEKRKKHAIKFELIDNKTQSTDTCELEKNQDKKVFVGAGRSWNQNRKGTLVNNNIKGEYIGDYNLKLVKKRGVSRKLEFKEKTKLNNNTVKKDGNVKSSKENKATVCRKRQLRGKNRVKYPIYKNEENEGVNFTLNTKILRSMQKRKLMNKRKVRIRKLRANDYSTEIGGSEVTDKHDRPKKSRNVSLKRKLQCIKRRRLNDESTLRDLGKQEATTKSRAVNCNLDHLEAVINNLKASNRGKPEQPKKREKVISKLGETKYCNISRIDRAKRLKLTPVESLADKLKMRGVLHPIIRKVQCENTKVRQIENLETLFPPPLKRNRRTSSVKWLKQCAGIKVKRLKKTELKNFVKEQELFNLNKITRRRKSNIFASDGIKLIKTHTVNSKLLLNSKSSSRRHYGVISNRSPLKSVTNWVAKKSPVTHSNNRPLKLVQHRVEKKGPRHYLHQRRKLVLLLDVDLTLVHTISDRAKATYCCRHPDLKKSCIELDFEDPKIPTGTRFFAMERPGLQEFLREASKLYDIVIYSGGTRAYLENLFSKLDPHKELIRRIISMHDDKQQTKSVDKAFPDREACVIVDDLPRAWSTPDDVYAIPRFAFWDKWLPVGEVSRLAEQYGTDDELRRCLTILKEVHASYYERIDSQKPHSAPELLKISRRLKTPVKPKN